MSSSQVLLKIVNPTITQGELFSFTFQRLPQDGAMNIWTCLWELIINIDIEKEMWGIKQICPQLSTYQWTNGVLVTTSLLFWSLLHYFKRKRWTNWYHPVYLCINLKKSKMIAKYNYHKHTIFRISTGATSIYVLLFYYKISTQSSKHIPHALNVTNNQPLFEPHNHLLVQSMFMWFKMNMA